MNFDAMIAGYGKSQKEWSVCRCFRKKKRCTMEIAVAIRRDAFHCNQLCENSFSENIYSHLSPPPFVQPLPHRIDVYTIY